MILRLQENNIKAALSKNMVILIMGARQVGKTTLLKKLMLQLTNKESTLYFNCDLDEDKNLINTTSLTQLKKLTQKIKYLFIDEAQRLDNPGLILKIIHDNLKSVKVIATGSSSFELKNKITDALTGRYLDFHLYPFSLEEVTEKKSFPYLLNEVLIYGLYPDIYLGKKAEEKIVLLNKIIESYLFKDIFTFQKIRYPQIIQDLTKTIAYQIGAEVNENELATRLKVDRKTIISYLDILERAYIIKRIYPFSKNPRREIGRKYKIYFIDLGIRNGLIGDFNQLSIRKDFGSLWENFLIMERLKLASNHSLLINSFFWRSYGGAEIDYLEQSKVNGKLATYEIKYKKNSLSRGAKEFKKKYKISVKVINKENFADFISNK